MIGTNHFIFIHQPKTGGTFVTSVLWQLQDLLGTVELTRRSFLFLKSKIKHGTCRDIPAPHWDRPILGIVRNPYDRYVSQYEFKWWRRTEYLKYFHRLPGFERRYPSFPDITFPDYLGLVNHTFSASKRFDWDSEEGFGQQTAQFFHFFSRHPERIPQLLSKRPASSEELRDSLFNVHFLRTHRLNEGLHEFLISNGCPLEQVAFVLSLGRILPDGSKRKEDMRWEGYYSRKDKEKVRQKERLIFELFPEFDV